MFIYIHILSYSMVMSVYFSYIVTVIWGCGINVCKSKLVIVV